MGKSDRLKGFSCLRREAGLAGLEAGPKAGLEYSRAGRPALGPAWQCLEAGQVPDAAGLGAGLGWPNCREAGLEAGLGWPRNGGGWAGARGGQP